VDLQQAETREAYDYIATSFQYTFLGGRVDVTELLEDRGTLQARRWEQLAWELPETSLSPCWWLTNLATAALAAEPSYVNKSLVVMRAELRRTRVATMDGLAAELRRRKEVHDQARHGLETNAAWERLAQDTQRRQVKQPTEAHIAALRAWAEMTLTEAALLAEREGGEAAEDEVIACSDICEVCATLETERHEELHRERFHSTPLELFMEMLRSVLEREPQDRARAEWRKERMRQATEQTTAETEHEDEAADVGGLEKAAAATGLRSLDPDPDGFVEGTLRLPPGHARATAIAEAVLLDRVQELLDRHYDEVFTRSWLDAHVAPATSGVV